MRCNHIECTVCPYGKEDYERRISWFPDNPDPYDLNIWCDKVGGKVWFWGYCEDVYCNNSKPKAYSKKKRKTKRERDFKYKNHLKNLAENSSHYPQSAYYTDEIWIKSQGWVENPKAYYKRLYRGQRSKHLKKQSNRKIRRYKGELQNGWYCHKLFDFWWEYI